MNGGDCGIVVQQDIDVGGLFLCIYFGQVRYKAQIRSLDMICLFCIIK